MMYHDSDEADLLELNNSLNILATIFPRILPEVFRELLHTFSGDSCLQVAVEQLLKHQDQWVRGRWRLDDTNRNEVAKSPSDAQQLISAADEFRRARYKWATRKMLYEEFKVLSRSKIEAVLAEENFCYSRTRPTLQKLASKTWRKTLSALIAKWRKSADSQPKDHYVLVWPTTQGEHVETVPSLRETGDAELDCELRQRVLKPFLRNLEREREASDWNVAMATNHAEAEHARALYECQCCYSDTTFEQMAFCTTGEHIVCFHCIWHAVSEALFGQSWAQNIEHDQGQLKCLASVTTERCEGCIPQKIAKRAIMQSPGGKEALTKLESRLAEEAISKSSIPLVRCPFCTYVEVDDLYFPPKSIQYRINTNHSRSTFLLVLVMLTLLPLVLAYGALSHTPLLRGLPYLADLLSQSLAHLSRAHHHSQRFKCRSPLCGMPSCLTCLKPFRDPHICHESATLSLRTTVEAARTAALKRTCPRCGLGFIKDSGCNKLTCVCGYSMCYICRQGLGRGDGGEGYRHFCQHFRAAGGFCKECNKCDLYKNEDNESLVRKAGALAEKEWREREGMVGVEGIEGGQAHSSTKSWWEKDRTVQGLMDWWVAKVLTC